MKCMNNCLWYMSLRLGAYIICFVLLITSITICILVHTRISITIKVFPNTLKVLVTVLSMAHGLLFFSTCALLYGLCMEKLWPLLAFLPAATIVAIDEIIIIAYLIVEQDSLPNEAIKIAAGQSFLLVAILFSAAEIFSLYMQWREDIEEGRQPHALFED